MKQETIDRIRKFTYPVEKAKGSAVKYDQL